MSETGRLPGHEVGEARGQPLKAPQTFGGQQAALAGEAALIQEPVLAEKHPTVR